MPKAKANNARRDLLFVIGAFIAVIIAAVALTLFFRSIALSQSTGKGNFVTDMLGISPPPQVSPNIIPMQDAFVACRARVMSDAGSQLMNTRFDTRSSRFDADRNEYVIFMDVFMRPTDRSGVPLELWSRCNISAVTLEITEFRLNSDQGFFGLFGF